MKKRCQWVNLNNPLYISYHDNEWGQPLYDEQKIYELFILECFQAGLSWEIILNKRAAFTKAFDNFDMHKIASYNQDKINELMNNADIVRNKLKIKACINNTKIILELKKKTSFADYLWQFTNYEIIYPEIHQTHNALSDTISADLKKRGMHFVGTITIYAFLQAMGIINEHDKECYCYKKHR